MKKFTKRLFAAQVVAALAVGASAAYAAAPANYDEVVAAKDQSQTSTKDLRIAVTPATTNSIDGGTYTSSDNSIIVMPKGAAGQVERNTTFLGTNALTAGNTAYIPGSLAIDKASTTTVKAAIISLGDTVPNDPSTDPTTLDVAGTLNLTATAQLDNNAIKVANDSEGRPAPLSGGVQITNMVYNQGVLNITGSNIGVDGQFANDAKATTTITAVPVVANGKVVTEPAAQGRQGALLSGMLNIAGGIMNEGTAAITANQTLLGALGNTGTMTIQSGADDGSKLVADTKLLVLAPQQDGSVLPGQVQNQGSLTINLNKAGNQNGVFQAGDVENTPKATLNVTSSKVALNSLANTGDATFTTKTGSVGNLVNTGTLTVLGSADTGNTFSVKDWGSDQGALKDKGGTLRLQNNVAFSVSGAVHGRTKVETISPVSFKDKTSKDGSDYAKEASILLTNKPADPQAFYGISKDADGNAVVLELNPTATGATKLSWTSNALTKKAADTDVLQLRTVADVGRQLVATVNGAASQAFAAGEGKDLWATTYGTSYSNSNPYGEYDNGIWGITVGKDVKVAAADDMKTRTGLMASYGKASADLTNKSSLQFNDKTGKYELATVTGANNKASLWSLGLYHVVNNVAKGSEQRYTMSYWRGHDKLAFGAESVSPKLEGWTLSAADTQRIAETKTGRLEGLASLDYTNLRGDAYTFGSHYVDEGSQDAFVGGLGLKYTFLNAKQAKPYLAFTMNHNFKQGKTEVDGLSYDDLGNRTWWNVAVGTQAKLTKGGTVLGELSYNHGNGSNKSHGLQGQLQVELPF